MRCLEIRVGEAEFLNPHPRTSIGLGGRLERELREDQLGRVAPRAVFRRFPSLFAAHRRFRR